jgi:iron complex outermembrane recepter protein
MFRPATLAGVCIAALAQTASMAAADPATTVSDVTVTARSRDAAIALTATKTDTPALDTPINAQVVSQAVLDDQAVINLSDALRNISGVVVGAGGGADNGQPYSSIYLRGFGSDSHVRNGVRLDSFGSDSSTEATQFANIESVTVLKGPAAVLYGAVEPGGIVNIVTKQPSAAPALSIEQEIGSYDLYRTTLDVNGPLNRSGSLVGRIDASYENSGSPTQFIFNHTIFVAPVVAWRATSRDRLRLELEFQDLVFGQNYGYVPLYNGVILNPDIGINYGEYSPDHERTYLVGLGWTHQFNAAWSLKYQGLLRNTRQFSAGVFPYWIDNAADTGVETPSGVVVGRAQNQINGNDTTVSQNLDLVGHFTFWDVRHTLLAGGDFERFAYRGAIHQAGFVDANLSYTDAYYPDHPGSPFSGPVTPYIADNQQVNTVGLYLQDQASLPHGFRILLGFRYQYINENSAFGFLGPLSPSPTLNASAVTPRVGVVWRLRPWISLYGNYAGNFGPSNGALQPNGQVVPPTGARSWEAGVKTELAHGLVTASLDYYDLTKTNIPTPDPLNPNFELVIGAARSHGLEFDFQGQITPSWFLLANAAYTDARIVMASALDNSPPGTPLGEVPQYTARLWTSYELRHGPAKGLKFGGGVTINGPEPYLYAGANPPMIGAWRTVDAMIAYPFKAGGRRVTAQLNIRNLFDRRYYSDIQAAGFSAALAGYSGETALQGEPRTFIGSLKVDF